MMMMKTAVLLLVATFVQLAWTTAVETPKAEVKAEQVERVCPCESDLGDSCGPLNPCCPGLICKAGSCSTQCRLPGTPCTLSESDPCCSLSNERCLRSLENPELLQCMPCIPKYGTCTPGLPPQFQGSCCAGLTCTSTGIYNNALCL